MERSQSNCKNLLSETECCDIVLKACGEVKLLSYEILPASIGVVGFLGEYYTLIVKYSMGDNDVNEKQFFIKSLPVNNELQRKEINALGFMKKEILLYKSLFAEMKKYSSFKWHPDMYLARDDLLVLENLFESGYKHINFDHNTSPEYIQPVLECMAAMHANSIVYEVNTNTSIREKFSDCIYETSIRRENSWVVAGLKAISFVASLHPKLQRSDFQKFIKTRLSSKLDTLFKLIETFPKHRKTVCHRDLWDKNIFYMKRDDTMRSIIVDFQLVCYCPPGVDFLLYIYLNTDKQNRDENLESYKNFYYSCLEKFLQLSKIDVKDHLTWEQFEESCNEYKIIPLILTAIYAPVCFLPDGFIGEIKRENPKRYHTLMHVERDEFILECIKMFPDVGKLTMDTVEELVLSLYE